MYQTYSQQDLSRRILAVVTSLLNPGPISYTRRRVTLLERPSPMAAKFSSLSRRTWVGRAISPGSLLSEDSGRFSGIYHAPIESSLHPERDSRVVASPSGTSATLGCWWRALYATHARLMTGAEVSPLYSVSSVRIA